MYILDSKDTLSLSPPSLNARSRGAYEDTPPTAEAPDGSPAAATIVVVDDTPSVYSW